MWWVWLFIVVAAVSAFLIAMGLLFRTVRGRADKIEREIVDRGVERYTRKANFCGQDSRGMKQLRGNGILALTREELQYHMYVPGRVWRIPLDRIRTIEHPKSFKGRSVFRELLVVGYVDGAGDNDRIGILVDDPRDWASDIVKLKRWKESFGKE